MIHTNRIVLLAGMVLAGAILIAGDEKRPHVRIRGIYGGVPAQMFDRGHSLADYGLNAVWIGSGSLTQERFELLKSQGALVFAEFNTMHEAAYLKVHPDAVPVGPDGEASPPPDGWQGICPSHPGYRKHRMDAFRSTLEKFAIDGIWLDYHHGHSSWEQAVPKLPDTCFCRRCIEQFKQDTRTSLPDGPVAEISKLLLSGLKKTWVQWRCDLFTDWVREFRMIVDRTRPEALLGTFHCPWSDEDFDGARINKLAIDLKAQAKFVDVFSPMPYHARFGHAADPEWISRQTSWLGRYLGVSGKENERNKIWPIVQLSDWGEPVPAAQVGEVLDHGTRLPATGIMGFAWGSLHKSWEKVDELGRFFRVIRP